MRFGTSLAGCPIDVRDTRSKWRARPADVDRPDVRHERGSYGLTNASVDQPTYPVYVNVVILSAVVPTLLATTFLRGRGCGRRGVRRISRPPHVHRPRSCEPTRASLDLATRRYRRGRTRGRRSSRGRPSWQAAQPTRSGRSPNTTNARSARLGPAWRPRSVRKPLAVVGSRAADGATRPWRPLARIRRASRWQSSYVDVPPISVAVPRRGRARGGRGSSIDQTDRATPARSAGSVISSCLRNSAHAPSGVSAK